MLVAGFSTCGFAAGQVNPHRTGIIARPMLDVNTLARFVDPLPIPAVIKPSGTRPSPEAPSSRIPYYRLAMRELQSKVHRDVKPTRDWGYGSSSPGPIFETRSGEGLLVEWVNEFPDIAFFAHRSQHSWRGIRQAECAGRGSPARGKAPARERWLSGRLVCAGQIGALPLSQSAGRGHAVVSRSCVGD